MSHNMMIDEPNPYGTLETWERHLEKLKQLPADTSLRAEMIETAEEMIAKKRQHR